MADILIEPMKPIPCPHIFADDQFWYQVKWDGVRMLSYVNNGQVTLINKSLKDKTMQFPELSILGELLGEKQAVLDGEIIVLKNGKPHFPSVLKRNLNKTAMHIKALVRELPIVYMIFDLIKLGTRDLRSEPFNVRNDLLSSCLNWQQPFHLVESFADGPQLFAAVMENGLEGVVAKRKSSPYISGKRHNDWLKIKYRQRRIFVIGGFTLRQNKTNALLTGLYDKKEAGNLYYMGRAGAGLNESQWEMLTEQLPKLETRRSPFVNLNTRQLKEAVFIEPLLTAEIEYAELTDNLYVRAPVIIGFSAVAPDECYF